MKTKKIRWEKPKLLDLNDENLIAQGFCGVGSSDQNECRSGSTVGLGGCYAGGTPTWCGGGSGGQ